MKNFCLFLLFTLVSILPFTVKAQEDTLKLELTRDWGYGGFSGDIQGRFSLRASGPENMIEVRFTMDGEVFATVTEPPFNHQFETDQFPPGPHTLAAIGILSDGSEITGPEFNRVFLSEEEAREATTGFLYPFLIGVGGVVLLATILPLVLSRKSQFQFKQYGISGGAVCPRCKLPFARSLFAPNILVGKLERCPHCGKWAIVRRATQQELEAAERRYAEGETNLQLDASTEAEKFRKALDDTRYE